jgi:hypothetical protein
MASEQPPVPHPIKVTTSSTHGDSPSPPWRQRTCLPRRGETRGWTASAAAPTARRRSPGAPRPPSCSRERTRCPPRSRLPPPRRRYNRRCSVETQHPSTKVRGREEGCGAVGESTRLHTRLRCSRLSSAMETKAWSLIGCRSAVHTHSTHERLRWVDRLRGSPAPALTKRCARCVMTSAATVGSATSTARAPAKLRPVAKAHPHARRVSSNCEHAQGVGQLWKMNASHSSVDYLRHNLNTSMYWKVGRGQHPSALDLPRRQLRCVNSVDVVTQR